MLQEVEESSPCFIRCAEKRGERRVTCAFSNLDLLSAQRDYDQKPLETLLYHWQA